MPRRRTPVDSRSGRHQRPQLEFAWQHHGDAEHHKRLYALFKQAPSAICVLRGEELAYEMANDLYMRLVHGDVVGKRLLDVMPELEGQGIVELLLGVLHSGKPYSGKEMRLRLDRAGDGILEDSYWTFTYAPLRDQTGRVDRVMAFINEVTDQVIAKRRIEAVVAERTAELKASTEELEAFCYSVAHDLRAPLRSICSFTEMIRLRVGQSMDPQTAKDFKRISDAGLRMGVLIDGLLNLSRLTRKEVSFEQVDLSAMAEGILAEFRRAEPGRVVETTVKAGLEVRGDTELLRALIYNLLENAWKFTGKHPTARIELGITSVDGKTAYFVRDDGAGFDPAHGAKLFGAFSRLHHRTEFPGTGIGLATVQRIVYRHGGRIWAESAVEKGATFYFTLAD